MKLRTRFGLAVCLVLFIATLLPVLILYLLGSSGLVEVTYVTEPQDARQIDEVFMLSIATPPALPGMDPLPWTIERWREPGTGSVPRVDPVTEERFPILAYDPQNDRWTAEIPADVQRVVFTSPVTKFRVDMPAWLVLGSLPLFSLLIGILLSIWMSRSVTRPISQLAQATQAVGQRDLSYRVSTKGSLELQELSVSFNRMAADLEHAELTRHNLMADIAHELRTPLSVLEGNLRAMLDGVHEVNEAEVALLYEQTHHLKRLVEDLRELSLAEADQLSLNRQEVDLTQLVKDTVAHFEVLAQEHGIQMSTRLDEPLLHPSLDDHRMRQVLHNLLSNAIRYTPEGGRITVSGGKLPDKNILTISVVDTGKGISSEELPHIFNRFYHTENSLHAEHDGTGLGLAIVKALVEAQGGSITAQSAGKNQGSTFSIRFPEWS
jgi:signal transduction histidine kinase